MLSVFPLSIKYKKINFFSANTKYISSSAVKISAFSLVLHTREEYLFFHHTRWNIFGIYLKKSKYPLYIFLLSPCFLKSIMKILWLPQPVRQSVYDDIFS